MFKYICFHPRPEGRGFSHTNDKKTNPIIIQDEFHNELKSGGTLGKFGTRLKFPAPVAGLRTRWCSAYLKVDVGHRVLTKNIRFADGRCYLVCTGERAEYKIFEQHRAGNQLKEKRRVVRNIDHYRNVHSLAEKDIWDLIKSYGINAHPAYRCGFGRTSCMTCIFGSPNQWATIREFAPDRFQKILDYEKQFKSTISMNGKSFIDILADKGKVYDVEDGYFDIANSRYYIQPIYLSNWTLPVGAFGENCGAI